MALPPEGPLTLAAIDVGPGRPIAPDPTLRSGPSDAPVLWLGDDRQTDGGRRWNALRKAFGQTGLWPLLLESLASEPSRPWAAGELDPSYIASEETDAAGLLATWWTENNPLVEDDDEEVRRIVAPFGTAFPGLAAVRDQKLHDDAVERVAKEICSPRRLGLVEVERPADALAVLGWQGAVNHSDARSLGTVLRSWEDRFGVIVVGIGFDTLTLAVRRPPTRDDEALAVAAEHFAFCPDNVQQGTETISAYARVLRKQRRWDFWWD